MEPGIANPKLYYTTVFTSKNHNKITKNAIVKVGLHDDLARFLLFCAVIRFSYLLNQSNIASAFQNLDSRPEAFLTASLI